MKNDLQMMIDEDKINLNRYNFNSSLTCTGVFLVLYYFIISLYKFWIVFPHCVHTIALCCEKINNVN